MFQRASISRRTWRLAGLAVLAALGVLLPAAASAQFFETRARYAYLMDYETGTVLFQKDATSRMPPASLAKLMTMAVVFDALKSGRLSPEDEFLVSENAWRKGGTNSGGSTMFARVNTTIAIPDLMRGAIIQSGNDACIALAEGMAGTEEAFAALMNDEARHLGLAGSQFRNATGLPDPDQWVTARDLAVLAAHIIREYPEYYQIYSEREFTWNRIRQQNRNPLLDMNIGADGMKTGYTAESGYGLVGSAVRDGQRLIVVLNGMASERERAEEARKILEWGFRSFERVVLFGEGVTIGEASVYGGEKGGVALASEAPIDIILPRAGRDRVRAEIVYQGPLVAPVAKGRQVGTLRVLVDDAVVREQTVLTAEDVGRGGLRQRAFDALGELLLGWL